jgi:hypothetical protein
MVHSATTSAPVNIACIKVSSSLLPLSLSVRSYLFPA